MATRQAEEVAESEERGVTEKMGQSTTAEAEEERGEAEPERTDRQEERGERPVPAQTTTFRYN